MYIISKNKDYYDGVVGTMGIDKTIVYERNSIEIEDTEKMLKEFQPSKVGGIFGHRDNHFLNACYMHTDSKKYNDHSFFIVGFCGKLYLGWKFYYTVKEKYAAFSDDKTDIIYGYDNAKYHLKDGYWKNNIEDDINFVLNYDPINMFRTLNSPIFLYDEGQSRRKPKLIINPILKDFEFYKVVDAFTAFQEIQMFLGGVLGTGEKEIAQVDDKYKIPQYGFDKWSFRREPTKK